MTQDRKRDGLPAALTGLMNLGWMEEPGIDPTAPVPAPAAPSRESWPDYVKNRGGDGSGDAGAALDAWGAALRGEGRYPNRVELLARHRDQFGECRGVSDVAMRVLRKKYATKREQRVRDRPAGKP